MLELLYHVTEDFVKGFWNVSDLSTRQLSLWSFPVWKQQQGSLGSIGKTSHNRLDSWWLHRSRVGGWGVCTATFMTAADIMMNYVGNSVGRFTDIITKYLPPSVCMALYYRGHKIRPVPTLRNLWSRIWKSESTEGVKRIRGRDMRGSMQSNQFGALIRHFGKGASWGGDAALHKCCGDIYRQRW